MKQTPGLLYLSCKVGLVKYKDALSKYIIIKN